MEPSAVSQQLRVLRFLGPVVGERRGRHVHDALHDPHVAHRRRGIADPAGAAGRRGAA
ncbi:MAG: hypothetical protein AB7O78_10070 [Thermoleophilia bacterium]